MFNTLWICEQADTNKADGTPVRTPKTHTVLCLREDSLECHILLVLHCLNNLADVKSEKYQKLLLNEWEGTKTKLSIFRLYLAGNKAKGVNRYLSALKVVLGQVIYSLVTIVGCVYRKSPEHADVKCFWICHMGMKMDRATD